ncbi:ead/Ea22-like family protein [Klebsiella pneumoniae]|nr:ead/Ea22-like family protein [Klebsiella pneumoniae]
MRKLALLLVEALEKAQQHIARQEQILLNQDESLSIRRGELEAAQQERDNWRTSFDNERFRADKLKAHIDEMTEERTASINELSRIIQKEVKAKREAEQCIAELESRTVTVKQGEVLVTVSGFTGSGKSAIAGEIEIAMKAIGVLVTWANGDSEKRMTGADWLTAIEMYKPTVRIVEVNIPRAAGIKVEAE